MSVQESHALSIDSKQYRAIQSDSCSYVKSDSRITLCDSHGVTQVIRYHQSAKCRGGEEGGMGTEDGGGGTGGFASDPLPCLVPLNPTNARLFLAVFISLSGVSEWSEQGIVVQDGPQRFAKREVDIERTTEARAVN